MFSSVDCSPSGSSVHGISQARILEWVAVFFSNIPLKMALFLSLGGSDSKESACNAADPGSIPGLGRSAGDGNGYPLQYSCLGNPMD